MAEDDEVPDEPTAWPIRKALFGAVLLVVGVPFLVGAPAALAARAAYVEGRRCTGTRIDDCLRDTGATVRWIERRHVRRGRDGKYVWLQLDDASLARRGAGDRLALDAGAVADSVRHGSHVGVRIWDGRVARIDLPGVGHADTPQSPDNTVLGAFVGLIGVAGGGYSLWSGIDLRRRSGRWWAAVPVPGRRLREPTRWAELGRVLLACLVGVVPPTALAVYAGASPAASLAVAPVGALLVWIVLATRRDRPPPVRVPRS